MDYPFFISPIAILEPTLLQNMAEVAQRMPYGPHPHFSRRQPVTAYIGKRDLSCELGTLLKLMLPYIPMDASTIDMWEVNLLPAGKTIIEHSDLASQDGAQASGVIKSHKIHIPLVTNPQCLFGHRRTLQLPTVYNPMPVGHAYAYNNYVWHDVVNGGDTDRYQMTVRFWDPDWKQRAAMLTRMRVPTHNNYEL